MNNQSQKIYLRMALALVSAVFCCFLVGESVLAADFNLQPAENATYNERIRINSAVSVADASYFYGGVHIGRTDGKGGVTFINGSILNASDGRVPVTFSDDVRVDGSLWRGNSVGPGDGLPLNIRDDLRVDGAIWGGTKKGNTADGQSLVIADTLRPAVTDTNDFGSPGYRWKDGFFSGSVDIGGTLEGQNVINENNLAVTNSPQADHILAYSGDNVFKWVPASIASDGAISDEDWIGAGSGKMYAADINDKVGIGISSGVTAKLQVLDGTDNNATIYGSATGAGSAALYGAASGSSSTGVTGEGGAYGGDFDASEDNGVGVAAEANGAGGIGVNGSSSNETGIGVRGEASSTTVNSNYGGYFTAVSTAGTGVYGTAPTTGMYGRATGTGAGTGYGGYFRADQDSGYGVAGVGTGVTGRGVYGHVTSTTGTNYGGYFASDSADGIGSFSASNKYGSQAYVSPGGALTFSSAVIGQNYDGTTAVTDLSGAVSGHYGGFFESSSTSGRAVYGNALATSGTNYGGYFETGSSSGYGVRADGGTYGAYFSASSGTGVAAEGSSRGGYFATTGGEGVVGSGTTYGGNFNVSGNTGIGVRGIADQSGAYENIGGEFRADGQNGIGVSGLAGQTGAYTNYGGKFSAYGDSGRGVYGWSDGASGRGVEGFQANSSGYSGYFDGGNFYVELDTPGTNMFRIADSTGSLTGLTTGAPVADVQIEADGDLVQVVSSRRFKKNINDLSVDTNSVLQIQPVSFTYKDGDASDIGLIAEDVDKLIPELVTYDQADKPFGVKYDRVSVYNLEVIKEQQKTIESQDKRIEQLESTICKYIPQEEMCQ